MVEVGDWKDNRGSDGDSRNTKHTAHPAANEGIGRRRASRDAHLDDDIDLAPGGEP
jgi:hypothetical protein